MSYQAQADLTINGNFTSRSIAAATQQADTFKDDQRPNYVALAEAILRGQGDPTMAFVRLNAAGPGIADKVDNGDGTIDQTKVTDADLLSLTQANWAPIADLYFNADGSAKP